MEGVLAVVGFWTCMVALALKKPIMAIIEKSKLQNSDVLALTERMQKLETVIAAMNTDVQQLGKEVLELRDANEFSYKLLTEKVPQAASPQITAASVVPRQVVTSSDSTKLLTTKSPQPSEFGKIINDHTVRFERTLPAPVEHVWKYLTESKYIAQWLAKGAIEPQFGGTVELNFDVEEMPERKEKGATIHGVVSRFESNHALAFSWVDTSSNVESIVLIELTTSGDSTSVVLTHSRLPRDRMHEFMAGWHTHLDVLVARLRNALPPSFPERFRELLQVYAVLVATVVVSSSPALAAGEVTYQTIVTERAHLRVKYDPLAKNADGLEHQIALLKHDSSPEAERTVDELDRRLKDQHRDLRQIEFEIGDLDQTLKRI